MSKEITTQTGMTLIMDPKDNFLGIPTTGLFQAQGFLPYFAEETYLSGPESVEEAFNYFMDTYGMGMGQDGSGWGTVDPETFEYISTSEDDKPLPPMMQCKVSDTVDIFAYQYGIIAVTDGEETKIARCD